MTELRLTSHKQHIDILKRIQPFTRRIEIVLQPGNIEDELLDVLSPYVVNKASVQSWQGTTSRHGRGTLFVLRPEDAVWKSLSGYSAFFISGFDRSGKSVPKRTSFGTKDIAFFGDDDDVLFFTTTPEGFAAIKLKLSAGLDGVVYD